MEDLILHDWKGSVSQNKKSERCIASQEEYFEGDHSGIQQ